MRFSQEISEDHQLVLLERGAHSYVSTFDGHPYVAPFTGNIVELCPVGALTSRPYRFRARPWDVEDAGSVCTLCPAQCNVTLTVRDERVLRVLARENPEVDDGWLCDRGRFAYPALGGDERVTEPLLRDGGELRPVSWERALEEAAAGLKRAGARTGALAGRRSHQRGGLAARAPDARGTGLAAPRLAPRRRAAAGAAPRAGRPRACRRQVSDLEFAHAVLRARLPTRSQDAPILDLRLRKGVRRHGMKLRAGTARGPARALAHELLDTLRAAGEEIVILWHERLTAGPDGEAAARALLDARRRALAGRDRRRGPAGNPRRAQTAAACARPGCCPTPDRGSASSTTHAGTGRRAGSPRR